MGLGSEESMTFLEEGWNDSGAFDGSFHAEKRTIFGDGSTMSDRHMVGVSLHSIIELSRHY